MKTAMELLGYEGMRTTSGFGLTDLELVAQRAREEMREMAYYAAIEGAADGLYDESAKNATHRACVAIRALPVRP